MPKQYKESIALLFEGSRRAIPFNLFLSTLLALDLLHNQVPMFLIAVWLFAIVIASISRWTFCHYSLKWNLHERNTPLILISFIVLTFLLGTIWGACYWLMLPYVSQIHEFIIILVLGGMCAGAIASLSVYIPAYYAYIIPMFLPIIVYNYWLANLDRIILATMFLFFVIMVVISANINHRIFNKVFELSREKESLISKLEILSITDPLTGLYNRRHFESILQKELGRAKRNQHSLILVLIDIDNFKLLNDHFGHPFGDTILITTANWLKRSFRRVNDTVFRIGGDEFSAILVNQTIQEATALCQRLNIQLMKTLSSERDDDFRKVLQKISLSIGIIVVPFNYQCNYTHLITTVDKALYKAKKDGKNRLIITEIC